MNRRRSHRLGLMRIHISTPIAAKTTNGPPPGSRKKTLCQNGSVLFLPGTQTG